MSTKKFIGSYELVKELGRGGMSTVYLARDTKTSMQRDVAVKVLKPYFLDDPSFMVRFNNGCQTMASLEHRAIVPVHDFGEFKGIPFMVMRYMRGGNLSDRIEQGSMSVKATAVILQRIAPALDFAHGRGVVHRDLKPGNILFDLDEKPYLSDFDIAQLAETSANLTGSAVIGTPAYMSPEQAKGGQALDGRSDIYSLGTVLFEMLTGQAPYQAPTPVQQLMMHILEPVPRILDVAGSLPPELEPIISRAMAKDPADRFATAAELTRAFSQVAQPAAFQTTTDAASRAPQSDPDPTPTTLPTELESAIQNPLAGVREGAVAELQNLLNGSDPALAELARKQLAEMAQDDSRRVSAAAAAALQRGYKAPKSAKPTPEPARPRPEQRQPDRNVVVVAKPDPPPSKRPSATNRSSSSTAVAQKPRTAWRGFLLGGIVGVFLFGMGMFAGAIAGWWGERSAYRATSTPSLGTRIRAGAIVGVIFGVLLTFFGIATELVYYPEEYPLLCGMATGLSIVAGILGAIIGTAVARY